MFQYSDAVLFLSTLFFHIFKVTVVEVSPVRFLFLLSDFTLTSKCIILIMSTAIQRFMHFFYIIPKIVLLFTVYPTRLLQLCRVLPYVCHLCKFIT